MSWKRLEVGGQLGSCCQRVWAHSSSGSAREKQLSMGIWKREREQRARLCLDQEREGWSRKERRKEVQSWGRKHAWRLEGGRY